MVQSSSKLAFHVLKLSTIFSVLALLTIIFFNTSLPQHPYFSSWRLHKKHDGIKESLQAVSQLPARQLNYAMVTLLTENRNELAYIPSIRTLVYTCAKCGSTAVWQNLFTGLTGRRWDSNACGGYIQNPSAPCWGGLVRNLSSYTLAERHQILSSPDVYRVAVIRHPFERIISAFKSKFSCSQPTGNLLVKHGNRNIFTTEKFVRRLRRDANLSEEEMAKRRKCMTIDEFAYCLHEIQENIGTAGFPTGFHLVEDHIRPQQHFLKYIRFDVVLDIKQWKTQCSVNAIAEKLPYLNEFKYDVFKVVGTRHHTSHIQLTMSDKTAIKLLQFAELSAYVPGTCV